MNDRLPVPPRRNPFVAPLTKSAVVALKAVAAVVPIGAAVRGRASGTPVYVRLQPDILARLDAARGGLTRPQFIRAILDRELAK